tara:strand:- start:1893 stop:2429 length:537 start_codon:yes stop_codon:yes gene_type:complete
MNLKSLFKQFAKNKLLVVAAAAALLYALYNYDFGKGKIVGAMTTASGVRNVSGPSISPADPAGQNERVASANGMNTDTYGLPPSCSKQDIVDPGDLLPKDENSEFSKLNPQGAGDLQNVSLLKAGHHIGINTVGQSLRNANLQIRSEPANPQLSTGPWNQSTITGDRYRRDLELGSSQ